MRGSAPSGPSATPQLAPCRVVVVGAGTAGLACAQELRQASHLNIEVIVLEARNRVGGRIFTTWLPSTEAPNAADHDEVLNTANLHSGSANGDDQHIRPIRSKRRYRNSVHYNHQGFTISASSQREAQHGTSSNEHGSAKRYSHMPPRRHSFSDLVNGVVQPTRVEADGTPLDCVDIGASIMHGCGDESQLVFKRAIIDKIRAPVVAGGGFYESTEHALWFDDSTGQHIPTEKIIEVHNIFFMASRYMAAIAAYSDEGTADMQSLFDSGVSYVCEQLGGRTLTNTEKAILKKICARSVGYCAPMSTMALMQASAGMDSSCVDTHIGVRFEEDDQPFPGEIPSMTSSGIKQQSIRLARSITSTQKIPRPMIASKKGGSGDRIVLDGYTPFLIDRLAEGIDVRFAQAVCGVSCAAKIPVTEMSDEVESVGRSSDRSVKDSKLGRSAAESWQNDPEVSSRTIYVSTRTGEMYPTDFVVMTLPLGVLKGNHEESSVAFSPPLSEEKQEAIRGMGMGVHNKVILRFREEDVFWPPKVPQLNCLDARFQFFNLHSYGKKGLLLVQVFAESGFADGYTGLSDEQVVAEVLMVLGGMFCSREEEKEENEAGAEQAKRERNAASKKRLALILHACENCLRSKRTQKVIKPQSSTASHFVCRECGHIPEDSSSKQAQWSSRLRERPEKEQQQSVPLQPFKLSEDLGEIEVTTLQRNLSWDNFPAPLEYIVTRWDKDPYALGSYSYMPCGSSWHMIDQIASPEPRGSRNPYLFFAGEHCSDLGWQCVHGAYETGVCAAQQIIRLLTLGNTTPNHLEVLIKDPPIPRVPPPEPEPPRSPGKDDFWTTEREKALTRALIGYSDVYGNMTDVIDEIAYALQTFKKEPTQLTRQRVTELVQKRIHERVEEGDSDARSFMNFHNGMQGVQDEAFLKPFQELHRRPRLIGLNGHKLKERYADYIVEELKNYAGAVSENKISYREALRKIALMIYKKDGGLMTKRCLSEYLRTQEFGTGPQKELFLGKYLQTPK